MLLLSTGHKKMPLYFHYPTGKSILMFGDRGYAEEVARLNGVQVRTGIDPYTGH